MVVVAWGRAEHVMIGRQKAIRSGDVAYQSKDGRFRIESRDYIMPYRSRGYLLFDAPATGCVSLTGPAVRLRRRTRCSRPASGWT